MPEKMRKRPRFAVDVDVQSHEFSCLEAPHPYGVLPGGNRFLSSSSKTFKQTDAVAPTDLLSDEAWNHILGYCSGEMLGNLIQSCRYFYVVGHQPELWRDLLLRKQQNQTIDSFGSSWKDTYAQAFHQFARAHQPMTVPGVYSDTLYRLHACRSFAIPDAWFDAENGSVPRISAGDMTWQRFLQDFERPNRPVVVVGAAKTWQATVRWRDESYCRQALAGRSLRATSGIAPLPGMFSLDAYLQYCSSKVLEEAPLYLFDRTALQPGSPLWKDYMEDLQKSCPYWDPTSNDHHHDLFQLLGEGQRPDHTWMIVGPKRSGSVFHIDPNATHAWNATILGRKRWIFYPPGVTPPGVYPSEDGDEVALPLSVGEWIFQFWEEHNDRKQSAPLEERPLECTAMPGDVCFVPHGWWHMVVNLDDISIAITHNYAAESNLGNVLRFLDEKEDQISGCRDRAESIKPEHLRQEFVAVLQKKGTKLVERALQQKSWTCKAWKSEQNEDDVNNFSEGMESKHGTDISLSSTLKETVMQKAKTTEAFSFSFVPATN